MAAHNLDFHSIGADIGFDLQVQTADSILAFAAGNSNPSADSHPDNTVLISFASRFPPYRSSCSLLYMYEYFSHLCLSAEEADLSNHVESFNF